VINTLRGREGRRHHRSSTFLLVYMHRITIHRDPILSGNHSPMSSSISTTRSNTPTVNNDSTDMLDDSPATTPDTARSRSPATTVKACWTTLITKPQYLQGLVVLQSCLQAVHSRYPLVVMVTPSLDKQSRDVIAGRGMEMVEVESLRPVDEGANGGGGVFERFGDTWTKLRAFELVQWEVSRRSSSSRSQLLIHAFLPKLQHPPFLFLLAASSPPRLRHDCPPEHGRTHDPPLTL
jgi:hypothetical protein